MGTVKNPQGQSFDVPDSVLQAAGIVSGSSLVQPVIRGLLVNARVNENLKGPGIIDEIRGGRLVHVLVQDDKDIKQQASGSAP